jgi:hypothetical protein
MSTLDMTTAEEERHVYFGEKYCSDVQLKYKLSRAQSSSSK